MKTKSGLSLLFIILVGAILRFTNLEEKPLWLDELITGILTFGEGYQAIPKETFFAIHQIPSFFDYQGSSCAKIASLLTEQSTHPPLFFCLMHQWLGAIQSMPEAFGKWSLAFQLRSLSAIFGIGAIALLFHLNRVAFSQRAGLVGAGMMAVSPFAVYLAQEARHYTFALILITVALFAFIKLLLATHHPFPYWLLWGISNSLGLYTHYFFLLAFIAQILCLLFLSQSRRRFLVLWGVVMGISLSYMPWLPTVMTHVSSSKTEWLPSADGLSPIYQLLVGGLIMVITLPVEQQPLLIQILSGTVMLSFGGWLVYQTGLGYQQLLQTSATRTVTLGLSWYLGFLLIQFLVIIYGWDQNLAIAPRYNYVYYPAVCALVAASLTKIPRQEAKTQIVWAVGILSSCLVVFNLGFIKPYLPELTAQRFNQFGESVAVIMGYQDGSDLALGLSYGLALNEIENQSCSSQLIFLNRNHGYSQVWDKISQLEMNKQNLWLVAPGLREKDFPEQLSFKKNQTCQGDNKEFYRIGIPYQRYYCPST